MFLFQQTALEQTLVHILSCTDQLFRAGNSKKSGKSPSDPKRAKSTRKRRQKEIEADVSGQSDTGK